LTTKDSGAVIFEIKLQHMPEAWWQLRKLYQPVVEEYYKPRAISVVEVCRSFDPAIPLPEDIELIDDIQGFIAAAAGNFGVLRWR